MREVGANRGSRVEEYLASVGLSPGNPYCAAFIYWCCEQAEKSTGVKNPFIRTGWCPSIASFAQQEGILRDKPVAGDVFLRYARMRGVYRACHTGFVLSDGPKFRTAEANTNLAGGREGIGVFIRDRVTGPEYKFVRWELLVEDEEAPAPWTWMQDGKRQAELPIVNGRAMCPVRRWGEWLGFTVTWDDDRQAVLFNGEEVPVEVVLANGVARARMRDLADYSGLTIQSDSRQRTITVTKESAS